MDRAIWCNFVLGRNSAEDTLGVVEDSRGLVLLKYSVTASFVAVCLNLDGSCSTAGSPTAFWVHWRVLFRTSCSYDQLGTVA